MKSIKYTTILIFFLVLQITLVKGQAYRMELGLSAGSSFYMGDANQYGLFMNDRPSMGLLYRYNLNGRFSMKANLSMVGISGTTVGNSFQYPAGEELVFDRNVLDAGVQMEINFYEYGVPSYISGSSNISPYAFVGFGMTGYKTTNNAVKANIPFGVGLKMKLLKRLNVGLEWSFRKTYSDELDYLDHEGAFQLSDPWLVTSNRNKNKDWYSVLMFQLTCDLYGIGSKCYK